MLGTDPGTDPKVKKKLLSVLASWNAEFKDDPSMSLVSNLFNQIRPARPAPRAPPARASLEDQNFTLERSGPDPYEAKRNKEEERKEAKRKAKEQREADKLRLRRIEEEQRRRVKQGKEGKVKRKPFNFEEVRYILPVAPTRSSFFAL